MIRRARFQMAYGTAASVVEAVKAGDDGEYPIKDLLDFPGEIFFEQVASPKPLTVLHTFIEELEAFDLDYTCHHCPEESVDYFREFLEVYEQPIPQWVTREELHDSQRHRDLYNTIRPLLPELASDTFKLLFNDKPFLQSFHAMLAKWIAEIELEEFPIYFDRDGLLKRAAYIPAQLRREVFFRDQGRCQICTSDLTGLMHSYTDLAFDHIVPLEQGGCNDSTNFQLLCGPCNLRKSGNMKAAGDIDMRPWWVSNRDHL